MEGIGAGRLFSKNILEILISEVFVGVFGNKEETIMNFDIMKQICNNVDLP